MNEEHIIAAILATGLLDQTRSAEDAVTIYEECLSVLLDRVRPPRSSEE